MLLSFFPFETDSTFENDEIKILLKNQLYGRICVVQRMMLDAVKTAQRQFPTKVYYKEEAAALIKIGDKGCLIYVMPPHRLSNMCNVVIQEDNVAEKYFHSRHNGIGHVVSICSKSSTGIGCGGCTKHLFVDWGDQF